MCSLHDADVQDSGLVLNVVHNFIHPHTLISRPNLICSPGCIWCRRGYCRVLSIAADSFDPYQISSTFFHSLPSRLSGLCEKSVVRHWQFRLDIWTIYTYILLPTPFFLLTSHACHASRFCIGTEKWGFFSWTTLLDFTPWWLAFPTRKVY